MSNRKLLDKIEQIWQEAKRLEKAMAELYELALTPPEFRDGLPFCQCGNPLCKIHITNGKVGKTEILTNLKECPSCKTKIDWEG